jgi:lipoprotein-anchoring transpeptidase ErfK/SrfK
LYVRTAPSRRASLLRVLPAETSVQVAAWVEGEEVVPADWTWAKFADGTYGYGEALAIVPPSTAASPPADHPAGRWIDVNWLRQTVVAYEGDQAVHLVIASTGSPGWETTPGFYPILRRVADERMRGSTQNLSPDRQARATYDIPHMRYTQYFSNAGEALHANYWLPDSEFGIPPSHGCVGMRTADAAWLWTWATIGTPVVVH